MFSLPRSASVLACLLLTSAGTGCNGAQDGGATPSASGTPTPSGPLAPTGAGSTPLPQPGAPEPRPAPVEREIQGQILEAFDSGGFSYARLRTSAPDGEAWVATTQGGGVVVGETLSLVRAIAMENFHSRTLNRTFPKIWFGERPSTAGRPPPMPSASAAAPANRGTVVAPDQDPSLLQRDMPVAELRAQADRVTGQRVSFVGRVTKVNRGILDRNWVHVADASGADLLVTTQEELQVGTQVRVRGRVATHRDFGAGYAYDVLLEEGAFEALP